MPRGLNKTANKRTWIIQSEEKVGRLKTFVLMELMCSSLVIESRWINLSQRQFWFLFQHLYIRGNGVIHWQVEGMGNACLAWPTCGGFVLSQLTGVHSDRASQSQVCLNCSSISTTSIPSETLSWQNCPMYITEKKIHGDQCHHLLISEWEEISMVLTWYKTYISRGDSC